MIRVCQGGDSDGLESVLRWEKDVETLLNLTNNVSPTISVVDVLLSSENEATAA